MEDDRSLDVGKGTNWISLEAGGRAHANLNPSKNDMGLWDAMDQVAIDLAKLLARDPSNIEYWNPVKQDWQKEEPPADRSDIGGMFHEGGTLFMGTDKKSITDSNGKFHHLSNVYVVGPAVFPTLGDANPSLTGLSLARRTGDAVLKALGITPMPPVVARSFTRSSAGRSPV
jgi:choline dehydrogenase-like flavoprotein